jgi:DNA-binding IclR family transcriptional regulator
LERGLAVLEYLDKYPAGRTMIEISRDLGLPKNATFRITLTLTQQGYLERDADSKRLYLSRKVLALGYGALGEGQSLVEQSLDVMRTLRDIAKESVCLGILVEGEGFALETVPGIYSFRCVVDPGVRLPLHASSSSKAILGYLPDAEQEALLASARLTRFTPHTITQKSELRKKLKRIHQCGYAWDHCEHIDGVVCVAAPIFNRHCYPVSQWL